MIPVPPLDGSFMIDAVVRGGAARAWALIRPYGILILVAIMVIPALNLYLLRLPLALLHAFYNSVLMRVYGVPLPQTPDLL
jgi:Zn-dependent protease